jgi:hypothetical protein
MTRKIIYIIMLLCMSVFSQSKDAEKILDKVKAELNKIDDYSVDVKIIVDVDFLKIPDREAKIYFKKPDKIHIESEGFAMLPKEGLTFSPISLLNSNHTSFYVKEDTLNGIVTSVIKVIPLDGKSDVILSTLWVDTKRDIILKIESSRKPEGTFTLNLYYLKPVKGLWLPSSMVFTFTFDRSILPKSFNLENDSDLKKAIQDSTKSRTGKVILEYSNYEINTGIPDKIFEEKNSKK